MYKLIYYSEFKSIDNNYYRLEILKYTDNAVTATNLILSSESIGIDYSVDSIFKPLKQSACTVNVLTKTILKDLYTGKLNEVICKIYKNSELFWFGYSTQNVYSSDFSDEYNLLSLEFIDSIANLENVKYRFIDTVNNKPQIRTFYEIIIYILNSIDSSRIINNIYISKSFTVNASYDLLNNLFIQERNFWDENEDPQTNKEVLNDLVSFLGMSLIQFKDSYYLIDYEAIKNNNYDFYYYNRNDLSGDGLVTLTSDIRDLSSIGIAEANASISLGNVYNKINLISNSNKINSPIPDLFNEDDLVNQNVDVNHYETITSGDYTFLLAWFNSKASWITSGLIDTAYNPITTISTSNMNAISNGSFFQRNDSYKTADTEPSSLNWTDYFTMVNHQVQLFSDDKPKSTFLAANKSDDIIYKDGFIIMNLSYKLSKSAIADDNYTDESSAYTYNNSKYSAGVKPTRFACKLKIGDYYYNGENWVLYSDFTNNLSYYYQTTSKEAIYGVVKYYKTNGITKTEITETEYNKINLKDRFWLVTTNKVDDKIFNAWKKLDNKVSYKMNLVDAEDGIAIPLPSNMILQGTLEFELSCPDTLGLEQCYQSNLPTNATIADYCHIKDLVLMYTNTKYKVDIFNGKDVDEDTKYNNVIDAEFITDFDDIELKVNTYTEKCSSYSSVIVRQNNKYDYLGKIHNLAENVDVIQEQNIINKYYKHYSTPKYIYKNTIKNKNITPLTSINVNGVANNMLVESISYNLANDSVDINLSEF